MICTILFILYISWMSNSMVLTQDPIGLRVPASLRGLLLGTAAGVDSLRRNIDDGNYTSNIQKNYQLIVPEFEMKPKHLWLGENQYDWKDPDWLIGNASNSTGWVQQNGMQLRGHNLVWAGDSHIPEWLLKEESSITPDKAKQLLSDYIHTVVGRYRGKVAWWDVVNEAIDDSFNNSHPFNLRNCLWYRKLGPDYMKYAFIFAHEADPDAKLYYNDYEIEKLGRKANRTFDLVNWLRSQNATIHGIGLQWHTNVSTNVTPGDTHYQNMQRFVDLGLDFMVTELDINIPMKDGKPTDPADLDRQGLVYRALLQYVLHFLPKCPAMLTWGFTDRHSWIPAHYNNTKGDALPLDYFYEPKPAYWQMQEELARVVNNGVYCLSPQSQPDKYLGTSNLTESTVQLYDGECNNANEKWNITWLGDGTYRLSPMSITYRVLVAYNLTAPIGEVLTSDWSEDISQEWVFVSQGNNVFRAGPRGAWVRTLSIYATSNIGIMDYAGGADQHWILTSV